MDAHEIRMDHPNAGALNTAVIRWLDEQLDLAETRPILLTGGDKAFCAGLDLKELQALEGDSMRAFLESMDRVATRLFLHPAPTVAAVNGHAIAGGCVLALACDARVGPASGRAKFGLNEVALGACFPPRILRLVTHQLDPAARDRVLLHAGLHDPEAALALGLLDELADDVLATSRERLASLAAHPRAAYAHTKHLLRAKAVELTPEDERRFVQEELPRWSGDTIRQRIQAVLGR